MSTSKILRSLKKLDFENTFNPYFDRCPVYDSKLAPQIRRSYLEEMLKRAAESNVDAIWVGRDLGYRGGRRTGLALTDDIHFSSHLARWGIKPERPTHGALVAERTASVIWDVLLKVDSPIFLWNVFPLHPYETGAPFTNRSHNAKERKAGVEILLKIVEYIKPKRVIAIGNDAHSVACSIFDSQRVHKARHPSYGGHSEFLSTMQHLYSKEINDCNRDLFSA